MAARPLSLTELNVLIAKIRYPTLERKLNAMRIAKLLEAQPGEGGGTPYGATDWLRKAVIPLGAAAAWERKFVPDAAPRPGRLDVEAALLLLTPEGPIRISIELARRVQTATRWPRVKRQPRGF